MIASALRAAGRRTGLFTSPHLAEPTERIQIDGRPISAERFAAAFERVHAVVERLLSDGTIDLHTTYFETVTAMALLVFAEEAVETVVLEVGLGGRLDATNVVTPELCVITPIDFDHEAFLGRSLEAIAGEKAGILKAGVAAVFARQRSEAAAVLDLRAEQLSIPVARTEAWSIDDLEVDARGSRFLLSGELDLRIVCPLAGEHQVENAATAAVALTRLGISESEIHTRDCADPVARTIGARVGASRDRPRWRPQSRRGARAGGIHRALLCGQARAPDLRGDARQGDRRNRRDSFPARPTGDRHGAAPGARAVARVHTAGDGAPRSADGRESRRGAGDGARTRRRRTRSSLRALCSWWRKRGKCWCYSERIDESYPLAVLFHSFDHHLHHRDGNAFAGRFVFRPHREFAAPTGARVGQDAARGQLHPGARRRAGEAGSAWRLRVRGQSRQLHGHSGAAGVAAAAVPILRQEEPVPHSFSGHAPGARRTYSGGPVERARVVEEHDGSGAHHQRSAASRY